MKKKKTYKKAHKKKRKKHTWVLWENEGASMTPCSPMTGDKENNKNTIIRIKGKKYLQWCNFLWFYIDQYCFKCLHQLRTFQMVPQYWLNNSFLVGCLVVFFQIGKKEEIHSGRRSTWEGVTKGTRVSFQIAIAWLDIDLLA